MQGPQLWWDSIHRLKLSLISTLPARPPSTISPLTPTWVKANKSKSPAEHFHLSNVYMRVLHTDKIFFKAWSQYRRQTWLNRDTHYTFSPHMTLFWHLQQKADWSHFLPILIWIRHLQNQNPRYKKVMWCLIATSSILDRSSHAKNLEHQQWEWSLGTGTRPLLLFSSNFCIKLKSPCSVFSHWPPLANSSNAENRINGLTVVPTSSWNGIYNGFANASYWPRHCVIWWIGGEGSVLC